MHTAERKILMLKTSEIIIPPTKHRRSFDEYELKLLADSISAIGMIQPVTVRKNEKRCYELISGERRLRAARLAGLRRVPCIVHKADDADSAIFAVAENLQRHEPHFFDEALDMKRLVSELELSVAEVAVRLGISAARLDNKLRLLTLSRSVTEKIIKYELSEKHTMLLLRVPETQREEVLDKIIDETLNPYQTEQYINGLLYKGSETALTQEKEILEPAKEEPVRKAAIGDMRFFENSLEKLLESVRSGGLDAGSHRRETERFIEYRVRIKKDAASASYRQLKIC